uniref:Uncharacterized protein n=1 Tax=Timema poppense TaxID=170557 RepID=A0A7R9GXI0_TIMPO|nr:unnamed protein product [Timema poppensis]
MKKEMNKASLSIICFPALLLFLAARSCQRINNLTSIAHYMGVEGRSNEADNWGPHNRSLPSAPHLLRVDLARRE